MSARARRGTGAIGESFRRRHEERAVTALAAGTLAVVVVLPLGTAILNGSYDAETAHLVLRMFAYAGDTTILLGRSLALATVVTLIALAIGVPLAVVLGRTDVWGGRAAMIAHTLCMLLPPFILALGWFYLFGRAGPFGSPSLSAVLFGPAGAVAVLGLAFAPIVTSLTLLGMSAVDPAFEDAAALVARPATVIRRIVLPAARPAIALAALLVFTLTFSEVGVPMFLRVPVYASAVLSRLGGFVSDPGEAALLTLPLLVVGLSLLAVERAYAGERAFALLGLRHRAAARRLCLGRWRFAVTLGVWTVVLGGLLPLIGLATAACRTSSSNALTWLGNTLGNSLFAASIATLLITGLALIAGWSVARRRPGSIALDAVSLLGFVTPAPLVGVGLIVLWNRPATAWLYGSIGIIVLGYLARYSVVGLRTVAAAVIQTPTPMEEAAALSGAGFVSRLLRITAPMASRGLAAAAVLTFVFCLRDLETAVLYYPAGSEPLPVRILTLEANGPAPIVARLALIHVAVTACVAILGAAIVFRSHSR
jgi:iron(III) transport system permease protein